MKIKTSLESPEPEKITVQSNIFWVSYGPLKYVYKWSKISFLNNSTNIDIWVLHKEQKLFKSNLCMCVPSLVKIDN